MSDVGFRSERGPILIALMLSSGVVAIDATILATAVPTVVDELGGFSQFPWLFSIYLLAQAVSTPIYAKLSDQLGRKPLILVGLGLFLVGSVLCGFAWSMTALIVFRAVQGLGAGAIQPIAITISGDIYTLEERARVQGYLASVWAISSVVGPTLGGVFSQFVSWRWIFFVNIPLCLAAGFALWTRLHENVEHRRQRIDYAGSAVLAVALTLVILGVLEGGQAWAWASPPSIAVFAVGGALLVAFVLIERRAASPVLPLWLFSRRVLITTTLVSIGVGAVIIGLTTYVPTYLEGTLGVPPLASGLALAALTLGWPLAASQSGRFYLTVGFKTTVLIGAVVATVGATVLALTAGTPNVVVVAVCCFVIGLGMGFTAAPALILAQASVEWEERGTVTGSNLFARSVGSAVAAAVFGALANSVLGGGAGGAQGGDASPEALTAATLLVFIGVAVCSAAMIVASATVPGGRPQTPAATPEPARTGSDAG